MPSQGHSVPAVGADSTAANGWPKVRWLLVLALPLLLGWLGSGGRDVAAMARLGASRYTELSDFAAELAKVRGEYESLQSEMDALKERASKSAVQLLKMEEELSRLRKDLPE